MRRSFLIVFIFLVLLICTGILSRQRSPSTLMVDCPPSVTLKEGAKYDTAVTGAPRVTFNNGGKVTITWLEVYQKGDCRNKSDFVTRIFTITNAMGDQVRCNQNITLTHLGLNEVYFPSDTTLDYPDSLTSLTNKILNIPKTFGSLKLSYFDTRISENCNQPVKIRRQWSLEDLCTSQVRSVSTILNIHKYFNSFKHINQQSDAICVDEGFISLTPVGEFAPYKYKWSTGDSLPSIFNKSHGTYTLTVTDRFGCTVSMNYNLLSMSQRADIGGRIITDVGIRVIPDSLIFENPSQISKLCISQQSGIHYGFTLKNRMTGQYNYRFVKNSEARAGISTKDIVMIQRHILGLARFTDTLQNIAADVNYNFNITASDVTEIRRLILGIKETFTVVKPWYFLRKDWRSVAKPNKPIADIEFSGINVPNFPLTNVDVFVLKMGDIDLSYNGLKNSELENRNFSEDVYLVRAQRNSRTDKWIPVYLKSNKEIYGIQFKISYPDSETILVQNSQLDKSYFNTNGNSLVVSWSSGDAMNWNQDLPLFYIYSNGTNDILKLDPDFSAEWYDHGLNVFSIPEIKTISDLNIDPNSLFYPNPTRSQLFFYQKFSQLEVEVYHLDGKLLDARKLYNNEAFNLKNYAPGSYLIVIKNSDGSRSGNLLEIK